MRILRRTATVLAASVVLLGVWVTPGIAGVEPQVEQGALASFEGGTIDMSEGWQGAQTCAVFATDDVRCYGSAEAADRATGYDRATDPLAAKATARELAALPACADDWLCLYQYKDGDGRRLIFQDEKWQNLEEYGFNNMTSSWRNNQDDAGYLAGGTWGAGWVLVRDGKSYASEMGSYDNDATSVRG